MPNSATSARPASANTRQAVVSRCNNVVVPSRVMGCPRVGIDNVPGRAFVDAGRRVPFCIRISLLQRAVTRSPRICRDSSTRRTQHAEIPSDAARRRARAGPDRGHRVRAVHATRTSSATACRTRATGCRLALPDESRAFTISPMYVRSEVFGLLYGSAATPSRRAAPTTRRGGAQVKTLPHDQRTAARQLPGRVHRRAGPAVPRQGPRSTPTRSTDPGRRQRRRLPARASCRPGQIDAGGRTGRPSCRRRSTSRTQAVRKLNAAGAQYIIV